MGWSKARRGQVLAEDLGEPRGVPTAERTCCPGKVNGRRQGPGAVCAEHVRDMQCPGDVSERST